MKYIKKAIAVILILSYWTAIFSQTIDSTKTQQTVAPAAAPVPAAPAAPAPATNSITYNDKLASSIAGREDASANHGTIGWGVFGFASGFLFGLIGFGASTVISIIPSPEPKQVPDSTKVKDMESYATAYKSKAKSKNIITTAVCGGIGWIISIPVVLAMKK
jgi:hypothetical protein